MTQEADESQLEAGYSDETPAAVPEPVIAPPVVDDSIAKLIERFDKLESRTRNAEGHIGGLNHQQKLLQETLQAASIAAAKVTDAPTQTQVNQAIGNSAKWDALKMDFPDWADATDERLEARIAAAVKPQVNQSEIEKLVDGKMASRSEEIIKEVSFATLDAAFDGWRDEVKTEHFLKWRDAQPPEISALAESWSVKDAAKLLRLYEKSKQQVKQPDPAPVLKSDVSTRQRRFAAAVTPRGAGGHEGSTRTEFDDMEAGYSG